MQTWRPTAAGVLEIVDGCLQVLAGIALALFGGVVGNAPTFGRLPGFGPGFSAPVVSGVALALIVLGVVAILGGMSCLRRRCWGLALAGGICALPPPLSLIPILAMVLVVISKDEFGR